MYIYWSTDGGSFILCPVVPLWKCMDWGISGIVGDGLLLVFLYYGFLQVNLGDYVCAVRDVNINT